MIAIDPGAGGGLAWIDSEGFPHCAPMPETEGDVLDALRKIAFPKHQSVVFIEEVGGYVGKGQPGSSMFKFGRSFGFLLGVCMSLNLRVELVRPQKWQKHFGLGTSKRAGSQAEWKRWLKAEAQRRFPTCNVTLKTADALLILDYAKEASR